MKPRSFIDAQDRDNLGRTSDFTSPPDLWKPAPEDKHQEAASALTLGQVLLAAKEQAVKWNLRKSSASADIEMDPKTAYTLLSDQARLFAKLIARIPTNQKKG